MTGRNLEFRVYLPQLQKDPGKSKSGVKRFNLHKNEDSPAFVIGGSSHCLVSSSLIGSSNRDSKSPPPIPYSKQANSSLSKVGLLPSLPTQIKLTRSPLKFPATDPIHSGMLNLLSHPAFKQPNYTKMRPKLVSNNPILGYTERSSYSPEPFRGVFHNGNKAMSVDRYLY